MTPSLLAFILLFSIENEIEPELVMSIIETESSFNQYAVGLPEGSIGYMQLNPKWYKQYSKKELLDTETNIRLGVAHLAAAKKDCKFKKKNTWVICYNTGVTGATKIKYPLKNKYYKKVMKHYTKYKKEFQS